MKKKLDLSSESVVYYSIEKKGMFYEKIFEIRGQAQD